MVNKLEEKQVEPGNELKIIDGIFDSKDKYRKIIHAGIARWVKDFQEGKIKIDTVSDLEKLIKLDLELQVNDLILSKRKRQAR